MYRQSPYVIEAAKKAVSDHLARVGLIGQVGDTVVPSMYRIRYDLVGTPLISILIPNKDHADDLKKCISSIWEKSTYPNYEILVIENGSTAQVTFDYYAALEKQKNIRVLSWPEGFNYSAINNYAASPGKRRISAAAQQ